MLVVPSNGMNETRKLMFCYQQTRRKHVYEWKIARGKWEKLSRVKLFAHFSSHLCWDFFFSFPFCQIKSSESTVNTYCVEWKILQKENRKYFQSFWLFRENLSKKLLFSVAWNDFSHLFLFRDDRKMLEIFPVNLEWWKIEFSKVGSENLKMENLWEFSDVEKIG